jgi:adenylate cyclase
MNNERVLAMREWIADSTMGGASEAELLQGVCDRFRGDGVDLLRVTMGVDTLHPVLEGRMFVWRRGAGEVRQSEYMREQTAATTEKWNLSPHAWMFNNNETQLRRRLAGSNALEEFPILADLAAEGATDYVAFRNPLSGRAAIGTADAIYSSWATDRRDGFGDGELAALGSVVRALAVAMNGVSMTRVAETLVETYLGRDAGRRVLRGSIDRGVAQKIRAVLWFSDLHGFTRLSDAASPELIVPLLNDYADALVSAIHGTGGQVLKFVGDGILATFDLGAVDGAAEACARALDAARDAFARVAQVNARRAEASLPVTGLYVALHIGEMFYGNIGSVERLDFTVVGPAVNEASRIADLCGSLDQDILLSAAFAAAAGAARRRLVSVGRYALRGIKTPQELFTLDPTAG